MTNPTFDIEFKTFDQYDPAESISMLWYGAAGSGKTEAAGSYGERTLYLDVGKSTETFHAPGFKTRKGPFKGIFIPIGEEALSIKSDKNSLVPQRSTAFDKLCDAVDIGLDQHRDKFDIIVIDEATAFRKMAMLKGLEINTQLKRGSNEAKSKVLDVVIPEMNDFAAEMSLVEQFVAGTLDKCKMYNKHFLLLAHQRQIFSKPERPGEQGALLKTLPGFTGKTFPDSIVNMFDIVWYFEVLNGNVYRAKTSGGDNLVCKTRYSGIFQEYEPNVSLPNIIKRIREQIPLPSKR